MVWGEDSKRISVACLFRSRLVPAVVSGIWWVFKQPAIQRGGKGLVIFSPCIVRSCQSVKILSTGLWGGGGNKSVQLKWAGKWSGRNSDCCYQPCWCWFAPVFGCGWWTAPPPYKVGRVQIWISISSCFVNRQAWELCSLEISTSGSPLCYEICFGILSASFATTAKRTSRNFLKMRKMAATCVKVGMIEAAGWKAWGLKKAYRKIATRRNARMDPAKKRVLIKGLQCEAFMGLEETFLICVRVSSALRVQIDYRE